MLLRESHYIVNILLNKIIGLFTTQLDSIWRRCLGLLLMMIVIWSERFTQDTVFMSMNYSTVLTIV